MTDLAYETACESYPPSLWGGGGGTPPAHPGGPGDITANVASVGGVDPATLANLATLKADSTIGDGNYIGAAFAADQYVVVGDASAASWDGSIWTAYTVSPPPPPDDEPGGGDDDDVIIVPDPATLTVEEAKAWVDALPHNGHGHTAVQEMLNLERAGQNRTTLVDWLDAKLGAI